MHLLWDYSLICHVLFSNSWALYAVPMVVMVIYMSRQLTFRSNNRATKTSRTLNRVLLLIPTYKAAKYTWAALRPCQPLRATCAGTKSYMKDAIWFVDDRHNTVWVGWWRGGGRSGLKSAFNLSSSNHRLQVGFGGVCRCMICSVLTSKDS